MIRKEEIFGITKDDHEDMAALESKIDTWLAESRNRTTYGGGIWIDTALFSSFDRVVVDAVLQKYREAGWTIMRHDDQRDGSSYQFS